MSLPLSLPQQIRLLALSLMLAGFAALAWAAYLPAKAWTAQILLARAWEKTLGGEQQVRPWPWADAWPVARLQAKGEDLYVLSDASGRSLAFGPGQVLASQSPDGGKGGRREADHSLAVLAGHRDSHFSFLQQLRSGDDIRLQGPHGRWQLYRVQESQILPTPELKLADQSQGHHLILTTCYPFDSLIPRGPQRYAVWAQALPPGRSSAL
ncbi:class GN sortase [Rhodovibrionaceae bacterium A322]